MKKKKTIISAEMSFTPNAGGHQVRVPVEITKALGWKSYSKMKWILKDGVLTLRLRDEVDQILDNALLKG